jgi:hypothetical protein
MMLALALLALLPAQPQVDAPPSDRQVLRALPRLVSLPGVLETEWSGGLTIVSTPLRPNVWKCEVYTQLKVDVPRLGISLTIPVKHEGRFVRRP